MLYLGIIKNNMSKETAVEWFVKELFKKIDYIQVDPKLIEQAIAMEKEQIENAYDQMRCVGNYENGKQYYNETYGGDK
jgi:HEPN domain-containing protein